MVGPQPWLEEPVTLAHVATKPLLKLGKDDESKFTDWVWLAPFGILSWTSLGFIGALLAWAYAVIGSHVFLGNLTLTPLKDSSIWGQGFLLPFMSHFSGRVVCGLSFQLNSQLPKHLGHEEKQKSVWQVIPKSHNDLLCYWKGVATWNVSVHNKIRPNTLPEPGAPALGPCASLHSLWKSEYWNTLSTWLPTAHSVKGRTSRPSATRVSSVLSTVFKHYRKASLK